MHEGTRWKYLLAPVAAALALWGVSRAPDHALAQTPVPDQPVEQAPAPDKVLGQPPAPKASPAKPGAPIEPLRKSKEEWRRLLLPTEYAVLFAQSTERAFSSPFNHEKRRGTYICAACFYPLFDSPTKFDSGTGWPSFFRSIPGHLAEEVDHTMAAPRTEYHCARCGGHQGHVFEDGPPPTGQRWCNNGVALKFVPEGTPLPALRK
jgi:peptide-methionine (R)-S-oxide reductase